MKNNAKLIPKDKSEEYGNWLSSIYRIESFECYKAAKYYIL